MNIWGSKKFVRGGSHTICQSLKKILSRCFETGDESCIYAHEPERKQTAVDCMGVPRWAKSNKNCWRTKHFQAIYRLFFGETGHVAIVLLKQRRTVNSEWYTTICLPVVFQEIRETNRRTRITLQHDNASSHTSAQPTAFLHTQNINVFRYLKKRLMRSECMFWR